MYISESRSTDKNGKKTYTSVLLRESYREDGKVKNRTIANLSNCKPEEVAAIKLALKYKGKLSELGVNNESTEINELKRKLSESEARFNSLFEHSGCSILLADKDKRIAFNKRQYERLGYTREEYENVPSQDIVVEDTPGITEKILDTINKQGSSVTECRHRTKDGRILHMLISSVAVVMDGVTYHLNIEFDISQLKHTEIALKKAKQDLENKVEARTTELHIKNVELEDANNALRVLLQKRDEAMSDIEETLVANTKRQVLPLLEKIKATNLSQMQFEYIYKLQSNLQDIVSPFLKNFTSRYPDLTPKEIEVASLIRAGQTTKEIAGHFNLSENTIETQRNSIRNKLGIKHKKVNLRTYLNTFFQT
ncbi:PAS domain S-box protein [Verrucomicrobia bacterium]|nr:PAS domain S-box protein [Verrucomicrobiota bacterium]